MKRTYTIAIAIVIVVVILAAGLLVMIPKTGQSNTASTTTPGNLRATAKPLGIYLEWNNPSLNGTRYTEQKVYYHEQGKTEWQMLRSTFGNVENEFITVGWGGFVEGKTYVFHVTGVTGTVETAASNDVTITPYFGPSTPTSFNATWGNGFVSLSWQAPETGGQTLTGYVIHRYQERVDYSIFDWRNYSLGAQVTSFKDTNVTNGIEYFYEVAAINNVGEGYNTFVKVKPGSPSEPLDLVADPQNGYVSLSWSIPINNGGSAVTNYRVYRYNYTGQDTVNFSVGGAITHFNDTSVINGIYYQYSVSAVNSLGGEGKVSSSISATPAAGPLPTADRSWYPKTGDFIQYHVNYSAETGIGDSTTTITVTATSPPDTMMLNLSSTMGLVFQTSHNRSYLFGGNYNGADFDIYHASSSLSANKVGNESLSTPWGSRTTEHWTYSGGEVWILNGVVLKLISTDSGHTITLTVLNTNIQHVLTP